MDCLKSKGMDRLKTSLTVHTVCVFVSNLITLSILLLHRYVHIFHFISTATPCFMDEEKQNSYKQKQD